MTPIDIPLQRLVEQVRQAHDQKTRLQILGGGTKLFYGGSLDGVVADVLDLRELRGISSYEPTELVITARAGTPLAGVETALAAQGQCLAFEPPRFEHSGVACGTVGGMVAAGLSGPARVSVGSLRDYVLGTTLLNGRGEVLTFGGQVIKNVAGYDVSRLMAGSMGVLGVICEVSLKVLPVPAAKATLVFDWNQARALQQLHTWARQPLPINASAWHDQRLYVRLAGANAAVQAACQHMGGSEASAVAADTFWNEIRDQRHAFFNLTAVELQAGICLWRLSVPGTTPPLVTLGEPLIEWHGAQRWLRTSAPAAVVRAAATQAGGHATLWRGLDKSCGVFSPLASPLMRIHRELKTAFDPAGVFNPGRLYADL